MIEALCAFAWRCLPALLILLLCAVIWLTDYLAWHRGRRVLLDQAARRDHALDRHHYQQGVFDTARAAAEILRKRGAMADAAAVSVALLRDTPSAPKA